MTVSEKDLFLAILAMDSYNRGYDSGIKDSGDEDLDGLSDLPQTRIGNATIVGASSSDPDSAERAAGFYAVAYQTQYGTVISYRGTDNLALIGNDASASDIYNGWVLGAGQPTDQSRLALDFFQDVVQSLGAIWNGSYSGVTLTGHSLGGGLAAMVSALTDTEAVGFDHMPAGLVAGIQAAIIEQEINAGKDPADPSWVHVSSELDSKRRVGANPPSTFQPIPPPDNSESKLMD